MGEYIKLDGELYKLGTCEDLYYVRFEQLAQWVCSGRAAYTPGNDQPANYLGNGDQSPYRFRFPFPDEDGREPLDTGSGFNFGRGLLVKVAPELAQIGCEELATFAACRRSYENPGHDSPRFQTICPNAEQQDTLRAQWHKDLAGWLEIRQQRPFGGALWVVVGCPFCGHLSRLMPSEGEKFADQVAKQDNRQNRLPVDWAEVAQRIRAGYADNNPVQSLIALGWLKPKKQPVTA